ncbi:hypothetical protein G5V59_18900 [Nocardioides sp. W3-2-3]|uniref:hypothetical protein n=1 Tax=Nocardioides convexus TaxID=2712224 RepID=UPI00241829B9|nr:hypothetical protein [Nocardioides convexus]NHA01223.1 hypothetical protein [Nocardioides convexus]
MIFMGLPLLISLVVVMSTTAAAQCRTQTNQSAPTESGDLGAIDGPVGSPVKGKITFAQANIPRRSGLEGFRASMPKVLSKNPEFVTLNEASGWSIAQIEDAAPGYSAFRVSTPAGTGAGAEQAMGNVVLWKNSTWTKVNGGRVQTRRRRQDLLPRPPGHLGSLRNVGDAPARRRRRGLGGLHPPHDQPPQMASPARQPATDPAPAVRRRHGHPAAAARTPRHPRPGADRRRHEHPGLLHRHALDGSREDEGRRLRMAQPRRRLHLLPPPPGRPPRAGLGRHDGLGPPLALGPHRHERRRPGGNPRGHHRQRGGCAGGVHREDGGRGAGRRRPRPA